MGSWVINQEDPSFLSRFPESLLGTIYNPEPDCSKLGLDYPGLMWNLNTDLKALKENSV